MGITGYAFRGDLQVVAKNVQMDWWYLDTMSKLLVFGELLFVAIVVCAIFWIKQRYDVCGLLVLLLLLAWMMLRQLNSIADGRRRADRAGKTLPLLPKWPRGT